MTSTLEHLMRPDWAAVQMYHPVGMPGELAARLGVPVSTIIKLDANENPFGPAPGVRSALAAYPNWHRYPDPTARVLRGALAAHVEVAPEQIIVGNGTDELLDLLCRLFLCPGERAITCEPTFPVYGAATRLAGGVVQDVPRTDDFSVDVDRVAAAAGEAKLVFLCVPNNPSGNSLDEAGLRHILAATGNGVVVLDEAYAEYGSTNYIPLTAEYPHLIVLRTLSKMAGLAGLRVGYGICHKDVATKINSIRAPYNVNAAGQVAGLAALQSRTWLDETISMVRAERLRLGKALVALPDLNPLPSDANFFLVHVADGQAWALYRGLLDRGIMIRPLSHPALRDYVRISIGTPTQNTALLVALHELMSDDGT